MPIPVRIRANRIRAARTLGEYLGHIAATAAGVSRPPSSNSRGFDRGPGRNSRSSASGADYKFPQPDAAHDRA